MCYFINAEEKFSANMLFDLGISLDQIRERRDEIASRKCDDKVQKIFLTLWQIFCKVMEMPEDEEKAKLLKTGKDLCRNLEGFLWLLSEDKIKEVILFLDYAKEKVPSEKAIARSLMTEASKCCTA